VRGDRVGEAVHGVFEHPAEVAGAPVAHLVERHRRGRVQVAMDQLVDERVPLLVGRLLQEPLGQPDDRVPAAVDAFDFGRGAAAVRRAIVDFHAPIA
jgi:hypothetical protein